jgi:EpsI family protein
LDVGEWRGQPAGAFAQNIVAVLGVDEYVNRVYTSPTARPVGLYVGYYGGQRQGDTIHSPLNCLPGAGWQPVARERPRLEAGGLGIVVNRLVIEKGLERQVVLYWYQSHGRVVASEYWGKVYTVLDALRTGRTDAALVRIIAPVRGQGRAAEIEATETATRFAKALFPLLDRFVPR